MRCYLTNKGVSIIVAIFIMLVLSLIIATVAALVATSGDVAVNYLESLKAFYIAEAGLARARVRLSLSTGDLDYWDYRVNNTETEKSIGAGTFIVTTSYNSALDAVTITSTGFVPAGFVPDSINQRAKRQVKEKDIPFVKPITASSEAVKHPANHAIDGKLDTYWESGERALSHWLKLTFIDTVAFNKVIFYSDTVKIDEFHIEYYDGTSFVPVNNPVKDGPTGPDNMFTVTFDQVDSDRVRLVVDYVKKAKPTISEFEVYLLSGEKAEPKGSLGKGTFMEVH